MPSMTLKFDKDTPLHRRLVKRIWSRIQLAKKGHQQQHEKWIEAENRTLAYLPESESDAARRNARERGEPRYTTIQVPYSYALLMSAHTYWTSVFFGRTPIHQFSGRHGEGEMQVQAMDALIGYQVEIGGMMVPYYIWPYDAGKYGHGVLGHFWEKQMLQYGQIVEMQNTDGSTYMAQVTQEVEGYEGNRAFNVSPWDFMHDPRVSLKNFQQGEFCIRRFHMGWNQILKRKEQGFYNDNVKYLKDHLTDKGSRDGSDALVRPQFNLTLQEEEDEKSRHAAGMTGYEVYIELVPEEWGLGNGLRFPQKWCFTITEDGAIIIGATPLGYAHCQFPFDVIEMEIEGYGMYARGMTDIMKPIQDTVDWLINSHFFNVRAALNNQFIVDPSKLVVKDVQNSGPGFIWRLRPEAYGTDLTKMFTQVQVQDVTRGHMSDFQSMFGIGERVIGVNDQVMGALNSGQRKTATEVRTTTGFSINRLKTTTEYMSVMGVATHAQKLVQSSQQYYSAEKKLRRVGSFALEAGEQFLQVAPKDIVGFFDLVPVDGSLPIDRMAQANLWKEIFGNIMRMPPQVQMSYDWGRIFAWAAQLGGLKNINQFRIQVVPDHQLALQAQQGNVIPLAAGRGRPPGTGVEPGNAASTAAGLNALQGASSADQLGY